MISSSSASHVISSEAKNLEQTTRLQRSARSTTVFLSRLYVLPPSPTSLTSHLPIEKQAKQIGTQFGKTDVNGSAANPLFEWLKTEQPGLLGMKRVKWNFEKWLVGKDGKVKGRWASTTKPESLEKPILEQLGGKSEL